MSFLDLFRRKKPPVFDLTAQAYSQWLRAQRPPFHWFMAQTAEDREALASMGQDHADAAAVSIGYAVADPAAAEAGKEALNGSVDAEAGLVEMLAQRAMQKILAGVKSAPPQQQAQPRPAAPPMRMRGTNRR